MDGTGARERIASEYRAGLVAYWAGAGEVALGRAYEIGRSALRESIGLLEFLAIHHDALASLVGDSRADETVRNWRAAQEFLVEALSTFEMSHQSSVEANQTLHRMNDRLEKEAHRIAQALHDDAGALIVTVHLAVRDLERIVPDSASDQFASVRARLNDLERHIRHLSHELRPPLLDDLGLVPAIRFLAEGVAARSGLQVDVDDGTCPELPVPVQAVLYRIVQEALVNLVRHAQASRATVRIQVDDRSIRCSVRDDGIGMNGAKRGTQGLGLLGIREKLSPLGGDLEIDSAPGKGTELRVSIPVAR
jgi:signal transduction histidine kinase